MHPQAREEYVEGVWWGGGAGLLLGVPAGVGLNLAGYPTDGLQVWWLFLAATYLVSLVAAVALATERSVLAGGLATGLSLSMLLAPLVVVLDIVMSSQ